MSTLLTRRQFLGRAAAVGAGLAFPSIVPARALGRQEKVPASERITLGFIGVGGMGGGHLDAFRGDRQVEILAVCDVYEPNRSAAQNRVGTQCAAYNDFRELLDRKDIDAVVIATPDHWHTRIAMSAAEAGKDIYCEKPLTLTIGEGRPLVNAVRRYGRVFQVGSQQRSDANFRYACELVRSGKIGKLHTVRTGFGGGPQGGDPTPTDPPSGLDWSFYQGPAPVAPFQKDRFGFNFRWFSDYSGGILTDWGAHHNDIAQWGTGYELSGPTEVEGTGTFPTEGAFDTVLTYDITYTYPNGVKLICRNDQHGAKFEGTDGWVHVDRGFLEASPKELLEIKLGPNDVHLYESPGHHQDWLNCIRSRQKPICDVEIGVRSVTVCHLGNIAIRLGRKLQWDPAKERFVGDEEANRWLLRPYRAPWHL
ncbi:MAG TPA: Gfo/Idh/MocA family oxidoreductase [Chthonomonadaceae bacterium]|nr:Gfo/Idh/MocA family oxidoreductase [Chthonomonadaceae bacterium]